MYDLFLVAQCLCEEVRLRLWLDYCSVLVAMYCATVKNRPYSWKERRVHCTSSVQ